jgi:hypothetical protein
MTCELLVSIVSVNRDPVGDLRGRLRTHALPRFGIALILAAAGRQHHDDLDVLVAQAAAQCRRDARNKGTDKHR